MNAMALLETFIRETKHPKKQYECQFCKQKRDIYDRTDIQWQGKWRAGCQSCYMKSIEHRGKFNSTEFDI